MTQSPSNTQDEGAGIESISFGCRLNAYESEIMRANAKEAALDNVAIVNTCAVTAEAVRQARQTIRRLKREKPDRRIIVTGCAAQIAPETFARMSEVDLVLGNEEKRHAQNFSAAVLSDEHTRLRVNDIMSVRDTAGHMLTAFTERTRAFVEIQNGCDHRCTFCIIPYGRGNSRSVPAGLVIEQIRALHKNGYAEVVLTGVDITSWGTDLPGKPKLGDLVEKILRLVPELKRLRFSSLDAVEVDATLERLISDDARLMPHLHLSLQAGDDMILKRMKRRHSRLDAVKFCERMRGRRPDMAFGADLIAGFPTETEAMFENSLSLIDDCGLNFLHVFPFSSRAGTPAEKMPQLPGGVIKARAKRLRQKGEAALNTYLDSLVGRETEILCETTNSGHTESFAPVTLKTSVMAGSLVRMRLVGQKNGRLIGEAA